MKHNGRELADPKRRVFVCRLTDGKFAALFEGSYDTPMYFADIANVRTSMILTVQESRIPLYEQYELNGLPAELEAQSATEAASA